MSEVKWIKIATDMFDNRKIKYLRKLPRGNEMVLIWVMLLTIAGRCNSKGAVFLTESIPYTPKLLADELDLDECLIKDTLTELKRLDMIFEDGDLIFISGWEEHQNIDALEKVREQNRIRKQNQRKRQSDMSRDCHGTVTLPVTQCHATDKELDIDKDNNNICRVETAKIIDYLNQKTGKNFRSTSQSTQRLVKARLNEGYTVDDFQKVIDNKSAEWMRTEQEQYLRPETLFAPSHFESYLNQKQVKAKAKNDFKNFDQHGYDIKELTRLAKE